MSCQGGHQRDVEHQELAQGGKRQLLVFIEQRTGLPGEVVLDPCQYMVGVDGNVVVEAHQARELGRAQHRPHRGRASGRGNHTILRVGRHCKSEVHYPRCCNTGYHYNNRAKVTVTINIQCWVSV